jgi:hypothetical protein
MKNLTKKTIATLVLLAATTMTVWADGDTHCPKTTAPCFAGSTTIDTKLDTDGKSQDVNKLGDILIELFKNISLIF